MDRARTLHYVGDKKWVNMYKNKSKKGKCKLEHNIIGVSRTFSYGVQLLKSFLNKRVSIEILIKHKEIRKYLKLKSTMSIIEMFEFFNDIFWI